MGTAPHGSEDQQLPHALERCQGLIYVLLEPLLCKSGPLNQVLDICERLSQDSRLDVVGCRVSIQHVCNSGDPLLEHVLDDGQRILRGPS